MAPPTLRVKGHDEITDALSFGALAIGHPVARNDTGESSELPNELRLLVLDLEIRCQGCAGICGLSIRDLPVVPDAGDEFPFLSQRPLAVPRDQDRHLARRHGHAGHGNHNRHMIAGQRYGRAASVEHTFEVTAVSYRRRTPEIPAGLTLPHNPTNPLDPRNPEILRLGTRPTRRGTEIAEVDPACCHHGHVLAYPYVTCGWTPCGCGGHSNWICHHPDEAGRRCGDEVYWPPQGADCHKIRNYGTRSDP